MTPVEFHWNSAGMVERFFSRIDMTLFKTLLGNRVKICQKVLIEKERKEILKIVSKILDFNLDEANQRGEGLKILTPSQMCSR